jgi:uncharacterized surface protein with fasciclin (FAS1) repeats
MAFSLTNLNDAIAYYNNASPAVSTVKQAFAAVGFDKTYGTITTGDAAGAVTLFAPSDAAWASFFKDKGITVSDLLADTASLTSLLKFHMVLGSVSITRLVALPLRMTISGGYIMAQKNQ